MSVIIDVQGFKTDSNEFIVKEIAILCNNHIQTYLIKPPYPFYNLTKTERKQVCWIERNRGIHWKEGFISYLNYKGYVNMNNYLNNKRVYAKGVEKVQWISKMFGCDSVYNLEDKSCPSLLSLYEQYETNSDVFSCLYHPSICALKNVLVLRKWCLDNKIF